MRTSRTTVYPTTSVGSLPPAWARSPTHHDYETLDQTRSTACGVRPPSRGRRACRQPGDEPAGGRRICVGALPGSEVFTDGGSAPTRVGHHSPLIPDAASGLLGWGGGVGV